MDELIKSATLPIQITYTEISGGFDQELKTEINVNKSTFKGGKFSIVYYKLRTDIGLLCHRSRDSMTDLLLVEAAALFKLFFEQQF